MVDPFTCEVKCPCQICPVGGETSNDLPFAEVPVPRNCELALQKFLEMTGSNSTFFNWHYLVGWKKGQGCDSERMGYSGKKTGVHTWLWTPVSQFMLCIRINWGAWRATDTLALYGPTKPESQSLGPQSLNICWIEPARGFGVGLL